jgi:hypothetical protein
MYLILFQQKLNPGECYSTQIIYYGDPLYLSEDLTHFIYKNKIYQIKYLYTEKNIGVSKNSAYSGRRGLTNANVKKHIYDIDVSATDGEFKSEQIYFIIVQTSDVNIYLHNKFEFSHIIFSGMRFELIIPGAANF